MKSGRNTPEMNVTPLVDVVLVLLIIFMVVTPLLAKQFWLQLPKQDADTAPPPSENKSVVLTVKKDGVLALNGAPIERRELRDKVSRVMAARSDKVIYFDAADDAPYASTVEAMDLARQGGAKTIAVLTASVVR
jgi:biopolymer transport protein ExbD/biopolymer transport protein TolR